MRKKKNSAEMYSDMEYDDSYDEKYDPKYDEISAQDGYQDELPPEDGKDYAQYPEEIEEDERERRIGRLRIAAGVADFASVILGIVTIIIFMAILLTLYNWLSDDISDILGGFIGAIK